MWSALMMPLGLSLSKSQAEFARLEALDTLTSEQKSKVSSS